MLFLKNCTTSFLCRYGTYRPLDDRQDPIGDSAAARVHVCVIFAHRPIGHSITDRPVDVIFSPQPAPGTGHVLCFFTRLADRVIGTAIFFFFCFFIYFAWLSQH
jgi:hypothetical protein